MQDLLRAAAIPLQQWVELGAAIYVCGSLRGMADGVTAVLNAVLGEEQLNDLASQGRYRWDVY
ncbi:ferredoxin reductase domain-containing protein [Glaciimonas soli]|uniref:Oxidoreductase FAD/NAD(P)-binding domain-containing protein n=1 Tax=Glaciimonas soli TaxID=2590999 RepID=A0A843YJX1_9BURK|nr:hypothetical protein [Glaciimonas soli]MQR00079.1 hypothetical protein [Glaciimonas soli]